MKRRHFIQGCATCAAMAAVSAAISKAARADVMRLGPELAPGYRPDPKSTEAGLWSKVDEMEEQISSSHLVLRDTELQDYLTDLTCRLGNGYCSDMRVYPMRIPYFNASMAPNGMMQVWSGLLLRVSNEAQLSTVVGHEMGHYLRRHSVKQFETVRNTANVMSFLSVGLAVTGVGAVTQDLAQLALYGMLFSYSRDKEREADAFGIQLMSDAGYNPYTAAGVWQRIIAEGNVAKYKRQSDPFFSTHPAEEERVRNIEEQAASLGFTKDSPSRDSNDFRTIIGKHRTMMIEDQLKLRRFNQTELILGWMVEDNYRLGETYYYLGEMYRMRNEDGDAARAKDAYGKALDGEAAPPEVHRAIGLIHYKENNLDAADRAFHAYLDLKPDATDRDMILSYMRIQ